MGKKTDLESVHLVNHSKCMMAAFQNFRQDETMLDVTLACKGNSLKAHKLVLSACSPFFKDLFAENPCTHPIIILRDFEFADLKAVIDFIYKGELSVPRERLMSALKVAEELNIRGLRRSEPNRAKYEKLYNEVCAKFPSRKKRKRHRQNSSDSEPREFVNVSESDENIAESDVSMTANVTDIEPVDMEENSVRDKESRPVVLRVGDPAVSNDESNSKHLSEAEGNIQSPEEHSFSDHDKENLASQEEENEGQPFDTVPDDISSSQLDVLAACSENTSSLLNPESLDEQNSFQVEDSAEPVVADESLEEQAGCISPALCSSPESQEVAQNDEIISHDEGKRFVCSKCNSVFTSRINFMKHKIEGHNKKEKRSLSYDCQHCEFSTSELETFQNHLLIHANKVPYKCDTCFEEFDSEELYKSHLSTHEKEEFTQHSMPVEKEISLYLMHASQEKTQLFRCSVCFAKFTSKLSCQIHEKSCQGGS